jgi:uncharacterized protein
MAIFLTVEDISPAIVGGMLLSAGGSGRSRVAKDTRFGEMACALGPISLLPIDQVDHHADVLVATAVGAPGGGRQLANPDHSISAARQLIEMSKATPDAVIPGHVPGMYGWLIAAALGIPLLDAACNGRGHPTVKMGSLGLSSQPDFRLFQSGVGDNIQIAVYGNILLTSHMMRAAAVQNGGLIMACRGPLQASLIRSAGALGAISYQLALGRAVLGAGSSGNAKVEAALASTRGRLLAEGSVVANSVTYREGFDTGEVTVRCANSQKEIILGVCNEFMSAEADGERISTFPDLIAAMDPKSGDVLAVSELLPNTPVVIFAVSKRDLPMGSGIFDPSIYPDVEHTMNTELARFALDPNA